MEQDKNTIVKAEYTEVDEMLPEFSGMGEKEARELRPVVHRFMQSYAKKPAEVSDESWLTGQLSRELPEKTPTEIQVMSHEIIESVASFDENMKSVNAACDAGQSKEEWFADKMQEASVGVSVNEYGNYLANIDRTLEEANKIMMDKVLLTKAQEINQCPNLDGFIAEQQHVNNFNARAALEGKSYRAEVRRPAAGETYGLNSVDAVIKYVKTGKKLRQYRYQFKFGQDAQATIKLLRDGPYNNQRFVVPTEQLAEIRQAFPGKSVSDGLGGTENSPTCSEGLTKAQVKEYQQDVQEKNQIHKMDWNSYSTREMALQLGKNAALAGLGGAALATGIHVAGKIFRGEEVKAEEVIDAALTTGADAGVKAAAVGALKVGVEKGMVPVLVKGTPIGVLSGIVCMGIENVKVMARYARGEISGIKALDCMARTSVATVSGLGCGAGGAMLGAAAFSFVPVVGTAIGGIVGGMVGYMAGSAFGSAVYSGAKKIGSIARTVASSTWQGIKSVGSSICSGVSSFVSGVTSFLCD